MQFISFLLTSIWHPCWAWRSWRGSWTSHSRRENGKCGNRERSQSVRMMKPQLQALLVVIWMGGFSLYLSWASSLLGARVEWVESSIYATKWRQHAWKETLHSTTITAYSRVSQFSDILAQRRQSIYTEALCLMHIRMHIGPKSAFYQCGWSQVKDVNMLGRKVLFFNRNGLLLSFSLLWHTSSM